jgi:hypothetical protein
MRVMRVRRKAVVRGVSCLILVTVVNIWDLLCITAERRGLDP